MNFMQKLLANLAEIFTPLIPALIVGGLILGFRNIIGDIKLVENGTKTLIQVSQFWQGVHSFLWLIGEAIFFFLPVGITWSISKRWHYTNLRNNIRTYFSFSSTIECLCRFKYSYR